MTSQIQPLELSYSQNSTTVNAIELREIQIFSGSVNQLYQHQDHRGRGVVIIIYDHQLLYKFQTQPSQKKIKKCISPILNRMVTRISFLLSSSSNQKTRKIIFKQHLFLQHFTVNCRRREKQSVTVI